MSKSEAERIVEQLIQLTRTTGQPVAVFEADGSVQVGVVSLLLEEDDWFYRPVELAQLLTINPEKRAESTALSGNLESADRTVVRSATGNGQSN